MYRVSVTDETTIVERGERTRIWYAPRGDTWVRAKGHPKRLAPEQADGADEHLPAGTVWSQEIELLLPVGTRLLSKTTAPLIERLSALAYLTGERRGMRRSVEESWFVVLGNYRLGRCPEPESFAHARQAQRKAAPTSRKDPEIGSPSDQQTLGGRQKP